MTHEVESDTRGVRSGPYRKLAVRLASLRLTMLLILLLGLGILYAYHNRPVATWPFALPLFALALNLLAAVATNGVFRRQMPLLVFHLALVALCVLAAFGELTYLKANVEVTEGAEFDGSTVELHAGPLHRNRLGELGFANDRFVIDYSPEITIRATRNEVRWRDAAGRWQRALIAENRPLVIDGYRWYVTSNKGFAPVFSWRPAESATPVFGSLHLPRFPSDEFQQAGEWSVPGSGRRLWMQLVFDQPVLVRGEPSRLRPPETSRLVLRVGGEAGAASAATELRHELRPGEALRLPEGELRYEELRLWMGYRIHYDWTVPWLLAASLLAVLSLATHFWRKYAERPWDA